MDLSVADCNKLDPRILPDEFYDSFLSNLAKSWKPSPIWDMLPLELKPGLLSLLAGKPNPVTFPFTSLSLTVRSPESSPQAQDGTHITLTEEELSTGLQYNLTRGMPILVNLVTDLMKHVHGVCDNEGWRVSLAPGSQDLIYKSLSAFINPGDSVLVESPTYPGATPIFQILQCNAIQIFSDAEGITASSIEDILNNWPSNKPKPKLLYTIPYGSNPTGVTTSEQRRIQVLRLARKHNFLIIEDDPYFHLYFGSKPRPPSYFSLERRLGGEIGRVLRLDSVSKILSAGFRFGWVTGPRVLIDKIDLHSGSSTIQASSIVQMLVYKVLSTWGISGFLSHTARIAEFYRARRDILEASLRKHMRGLAEWNTPEAGMFCWVKLLLPPRSSTELQNVNGVKGLDIDEGDAALFIRSKVIDNGVLVLPGGYAFIDHKRSPYVRISFSLLSESEMDEAIRRLASVMHEEWDAVSGVNGPSL
ncbi:hypothetical protein AMATHDRAFT_55357 [Amanita thiersii Skay4041]|uniref:Aminotransferase class I/classII large domain-containing protein n=1 Tax=Amanita thiersii Skay4041 TaxID=703135 RepID=A0A2A9NZI1_9AGAR|nr:hypothetical protein AMATHDRAFT_55357 [Amanita thiersii Skay4041]